MAQDIDNKQMPMPESTTEDQAAHGLTARAVMVSIIFLVISLIWMRQAGIIALGAQVGESVPVIPAVGAIMLLAAIGPLLNRLPRIFHFPRHQSLLVYAFLCIAVTMSSVGVVRQILPQLTVPTYFQSPENNYGAVREEIPTWLAPTDRDTVQGMYEGSEDGVIPWKPWLAPLAVWTIFLLANFIVMYALMLMFRQQWIEKEHLTFPVARLVMDVSDYGAEGTIGPFLRNPLMWTGFAVAAAYNLMNMLNAWNPSVPCLGKTYNLGALLTERPWSALAPLNIAWRPENFGIGYLVSTEVLMSVWVFYLLFRFANFFTVIGGYEIAGMPFEREQAYGGYIALGIFLLYVGREHLIKVFRKGLLGDRTIDDSDEPFRYRTVVWAAVIGFGIMLFIAVQAGMWLSMAALYLLTVLLFSVTYARIRAEAGAPMVWLFPIQKAWEMIPYMSGSATWQRGSSFRNLTIFTLFYPLGRGYFLTTSGYQIEGFKIAEGAKIRQRTMILWMIVALVIGLGSAYYLHLSAYYSFGANVLEGGTTSGGARVRSAALAWESLSGWINAHAAPDVNRTIAGATGFAVTMLLVVLRSLFLRFPLHPLGYVMVSSYSGVLWGPFFLVWIIKTLTLRLGGMRLYRQLIPFFLGLVLGHYFTAGVVWGSLSLINEMYRRYGVWFG
ncbi:MAG: DUF6785 family protein [Armatimonadota bacterium]